MDLLIQMFAVLAVFAMVHERVLELLRMPRELLAKQDQNKPEDSKRWTQVVTVLDAVTIGSFNWVSGVVLALLTRADLLKLIEPVAAGQKPEFLTQYLRKSPWDWSSWSLLEFLGCVLMGFSTTVGSKFWHDAVNGLMELRKQLAGAGAAARKLTAAEVQQALNTAAEEVGKSKAADSKQALTDVAEALKRGARKAAESQPGH
ncbi:hypothetical protein [Hyalangium rubrum]|uniref:Uncharacterized protein n=1 Tax=Hyalangium rubrum TaxID=3103134 RepID=A0ABU5H0H9_9BACT|nr:hypothetical protein [Hyalangium sp. s54d21]MDY7226955.1 hypothetical protein [Hyalangium sp. s54d21]